MWDRALTTVSCEIQKCSETLNLFYVAFDVKSSSGYTLVRILPTSSSSSFEHFPDRGPKRRKQRLYFGDHGSHFTRKNAGFHARVSFQAWIHAFPRWHDGENSDHANCIFQLCSGAVSVRVKSSSRGSLVHILPCKLDHTNPKPHWIPQFFEDCSCEIVLSLQSRAHVAVRTRPHKSKGAPWVFTIFHVKSRSRYSLVRILPYEFDHKLLQMPHFSRFLCETELPLQYRAHFADLIFQKCSETLNFFLTFSSAIGALATVLCSPCTFCRELLQIEARNLGNRDSTSATAEATLPAKTQGVAPRVFKPEFTRSRPTTWWCGWHDSVVDMMVRMLPMTIVRNSEVV